MVTCILSIITQRSLSHKEVIINFFENFIDFQVQIRFKFFINARSFIFNFYILHYIYVYCTTWLFLRTSLILLFIFFSLTFYLYWHSLMFTARKLSFDWSALHDYTKPLWFCACSVHKGFNRYHLWIFR